MAADVQIPKALLTEWSRETTQILPPDLVVPQDQTVAHHRWRMLRKYIRSAMTESIKTDVANIEVVHGVQFLRKMNHPQEIVHSYYNRHLFEYVTNDGDCVRLFHHDGRMKDIRVGAFQAERFIYIPPARSYVAWKAGTNSLRLFNGDFEYQTTSTTEAELSNVMYDELTQHIVALGKDLISFWELRFANRYLVLRSQFASEVAISKMDLAVLETQCSRKQQRLFVAEQNGVFVFSVSEKKLLEHVRGMHVRDVTAIHWLAELRYLVTGSRDGAVKLWSNNYALLMTFSGHADYITSICTYPFDCCLLTASHDRTMRVWSLETSEEVMKIRTDDTVLSVECSARERQFCSRSKHWIELWNIQQVHHSFIYAGSNVKRLLATKHAHFDPRVVMQGSDGAVRVICPLTGSIVTSAITPSQRLLVHSTTMLVDQDLLFVLFLNGELHKYKTSVNPCELLAKSVPATPNDVYTCLLAYHHVITKHPQQTSDIEGMSAPEIQRYVAIGGYNRTYLLAGTRNGALCVLDWKKELQVLSQHFIHEKRVVEAMCVNPVRQWLITSGSDNVIKMFYLFPYCAPDILGQLINSFYCNSLPHLMVVMRTSLGVVFSDQASMTFNFVVFDLQTKLRYDHSVTDDHEDTVTALSCCEKLRLFATGSEDLSVRLWNEKNLLLRHVRIGESIYSLEFCSEKGDLLIGVGQHVRLMEHFLYLPKFFKKKLLLKMYKDHRPIEPIPVDPTRFHRLTNDEQDRFNEAHTAIKLQALLTQELSRIDDDLEVTDKRSGMARLAEREQEIKSMINGTLKASRETLMLAKRHFGKHISNVAYQSYFREVAKIGPGVSRESVAAIDPKIEPFQESEEPPYQEFDQTGFFPNIKLAKRKTSATRVDKSDESEAIEKRLADKVMYNFAPNSNLQRTDGSIPNSSLVQLLWPPTVRDEFEMKEFRLDLRYYAPEKQGALYRIKSSTFVDRERRMSYTDDEPPALLTEILENAVEEPLQLYEPETPPPPPEPPRAKAHSKTPSVTSSSSMRSKVLASLPPRRVRVKEETAAAEQPAQEEARASTPQPAPREPTPPPPPRPETPVPGFISQFADQPWFVPKRFPNLSQASFPKPWILEDFFLLLIKFFFEESDESEAMQILRCATQLFQSEKIEPSAVRRAEELVILKWRNLFPIDPENTAERDLLFQILRFLNVLGSIHRGFIKELFIVMVEHTDTRVRRAAEDSFTLMNLNDPFRMLQKQFDSWDTWKLPDGDSVSRRAALDELCDKFLESCMVQYKVYCTDRIKRLRSLRKVTKRVKVVVEPTEPQVNRSQRGILKKEKPEEDEEILHLMHPTYIDALNHFCEVQYRRMMERMNQQRATTEADQENQNRTVVMLPYIEKRAKPLVRLGELRCSVCKPHRETNFSTDYYREMLTTLRGRQPFPGDLNSFTQCIALPLPVCSLQLVTDDEKQQSVNTSLRPQDAEPSANAMNLLNATMDLISVKMNRNRYFLPSISHL